MNDVQLKTLGMKSIFLMSIGIGILTGIAAWAFRLVIGLIHNVAFLGEFSFHYDANQHTPLSPWGPLVILVPVIGGALVIWLIKTFAPEAKGHGVPEVMSAIHNKQGKMRGSVALIKALASAVTIGTGGSLGREGPIIMISSAMSSAISQWMNLSVNQRNLMIACGASGGIAATFNAPLGGILFSMELLLLSVNGRTMIPVVMSSVIAANVGRYLIGADPAFIVPVLHAQAALENPLVLLMYFPFAAMIGFFAILFIKSIYFSEDWFDNLPLGPYTRHMAAMLVLGILFYAISLFTGHYYVQGVGYATIQDVLTNVITSPWLILFLVVAKLLATCLTVGSGGSGGVFSPSLFLGAALGGFVGTILVALFPELNINPATFALVGMASMVAATTSAPMTAAIMTYEMTLDYVVVLPVMVGVSVAYAVRYYFMHADIYTLKLIRRGEQVPQGFLADVQSQIVVDNIMDTDIQFVDKDELISGTNSTLCVTDGDHVLGVVNPVSYRRASEFYPRQAMLDNFLVVMPGTTLREVLKEIDQHQCSVAIVSRTGNLNKDDIVGVFNSIHLTRAMATAAKQFVR